MMTGYRYNSDLLAKKTMAFLQSESPYLKFTPAIC